LSSPSALSTRFTAFPLLFFSLRSAHPLILHSFPTRRSSDLRARGSDGPALGGADRGRQPDPGDQRWGDDRPSRRAAGRGPQLHRDRKSTRLNSSHVSISYAVFCLKKKKRRSYRNSTCGTISV